MTQNVPYIVADFDVQLASAVSVGASSFTLSSATDDSGVALPAGLYCFTVDNGNASKEYLMGTLSGTTVSNVKSLSRQGTQTNNVQIAHRAGASVIMTDFIGLARVADTLRGAQALDGSAPLIYDTQPSLSDNKHVATVGYVLSTAFGGAIYFSSQTIPAVAGETLAIGDPVYLKLSDQRWWKASASTTATFDQVTLGISQGVASAGNSVTILLSGPGANYTGLTAGEDYYLTDAGGISVTPGTNTVFLGFAVSTTSILFQPKYIDLPSHTEKQAMVGTSGTPSSSNKFVTQIALDPFFGNGSDGNVTISTPTSLTRDMYYNNLVVSDTLTTNGYRIFVKDTISGAGTIKYPDANAGSNGGGTGAGAGGGAGGSAYTSGGYLRNTAGSAGAAGVNNGSNSGIAGTVGYLGSSGALGGTGGTAASFPTVGGSGGAAGANNSKSAIGINRNETITVVEPIFSGLVIRNVPGSGGGGSGGSGTTGASSNGGGAGGGAGASGGIVFIAAKTWTGTFTIRATGANGGNGSNGGSSTGGVGGGGAGGNGGVSIVIYQTKSWSGSYVLTGGTGGARGSVGEVGSATAGANGATGTSYEILYSNLL